MTTFRAAADHAGSEPLALEDGTTLLIGPGDSGKAARLLATGSGFGKRFFFHHAGLGGEAGNPDAFLWRLMDWIRQTSGFPDPVPSDAEIQREALPNWLARAAAGGDLCIGIADGQELSRNGLEPDLDWLPAWLPTGVKVVIAVKPGPSAELCRERADFAVEHAGSGDSRALREQGREILAQPEAREVAEWLWAARSGLDLADLEELCSFPVEPVLEALAPLLARSSERCILAGTSARALAAAGSLADHGARQRLHLRLGAHYADSGTIPARLLERWHYAQAGHAERLLQGLIDPQWLTDCRQANNRFEALGFWRRLGDQQLMVDQLAQAFNQNPFEPDVLLGVISLVEAGSGQAVPRDWLQASLTAALASGDSDGQAALLERLGSHPETVDNERLKLLLQALALREESIGPGRPETESVRHRVACEHEELGDLSAAVQNYRAGIQALEQSLGQADSRLIPWLNNLAAVHKAAGELKEAADLCSRALKLARACLGARHPNTASACDQLANVHYMGANYAEAEPLYREALKITENAFGPDHAATAACLNNLATLLDARQQFKEAEQLYRRALTIRLALHGEHHSDTASSLHNLATVLESAGKTDEAEQLLRRALDAWDKVSGNESPAFATTLLSLADLLRDRGQWGDAEALYRSDIEIWRGLVGAEHPHTLTAIGGLAQLYADGGKPELAEPLLVHVMESTERIAGRTDALYMEAAGTLAALLRDGGRPEQAREVLHHALAAHDHTLGMISAPVQKLRRLLESLDSNSQKLH
ncbi:tetratricopeptide repeat protein [Wenzhouxiangella limi]|uniref:Tetratricopeptide repeat protein n=1 Tax=Wenzhouxiangella limi TaxID=2707351 RepID=A0A845UUY8_9GAMM|nr:tetratricopeptide repeat protein [Wenzhouxiangella limi]NDY95653.1 tetratricopeptide repeat protein [Wenzhouxiangella limi]